MSKPANIHEALFAFSGEFAGAHKTGVNPHFKSAHFTLEDLIRETHPLLQKYGLYVVHGVVENCVVTKIVHAESDTSQVSSIPLPNLTDPQKLGSCITYYRRYNMVSLLNISEADDDGNAASAPELASREQLTEIQEFREADQLSDKMAQWLQKKGDYLTAQDAEQAIINIKKRLAQ